MQQINIKVLCLKILILFNSFVCIVSTEDTLPPHCVAKIKDVNFPCTITNTKAHVLSPFDSQDDTFGSEKETVPETKYINITIELSTIEKEYNMYINNKYGVVETVWLVQLPSVIDYVPITNSESQYSRERCYRFNDTTDTIGVLHVSVIPVPENFNGGITVSKKPNYIDLMDPCKKANSSKECDILCNATVTLMPYPTEKMVILNINAASSLNLKIQLWVGDCPISCNGSINDCPIKIEEYICPKVESEAGGVYQFDQLETGYYCVRVQSFDNECCIRGTGYEHLEGAPMEVFTSILVKTNKYVFGVVLFVVSVVIFSAFALKKLSHASYNDFENDPAESAALSIIIPSIKIQSDVKVLLIYSRQSDEFVKKMEDLAMTLQEYVGEVIDPLGKDEKKFIRSPIPMAINFMNRKDVKILLVANQQGLEIEKGLTENKPIEPDNPYRLDEIFQHVLSTILFEPARYSDYKHVFMASYEKGLGFRHGVPGARYVIPEQEQKLIHDLIV